MGLGYTKRVQPGIWPNHDTEEFLWVFSVSSRKPAKSCLAAKKLKPLPRRQPPIPRPSGLWMRSTTRLRVEYDGATGTVDVSGQAPTQEALEKVTLCCGNVASVKQVNNLMAVSSPEPEAQYHDVVRGDTLSAIAKKYYGDANKYPKIFEANKPMLSHPDKIYPGQKLRIPAL